MTRQPRLVSGFILAGGASSRMAQDKALLQITGTELVVRAAKLLDPLVADLTVIAPAGRYDTLGLSVVPDDKAGLGPLGGIATALRKSSQPWALVVGCDLPFLTAAWLSYLISRTTASDADVVLPESARGLEPLCAVYHTRAWPAIRDALGRGVRKVTDGLAGLQVEIIPARETKRFDSDGWLFKNVNTPGEYEDARRQLERGGAE